MKLKAKYKWNGEDVLVKPIFFSWLVGIQYKTLTGRSASSIFCNREKEFLFPIQSKYVIFFLKIYFWIRYYFWMQIRYWLPNRIKRLISKKETTDGLPF
jgi:hypothetical protein